MKTCTVCKVEKPLAGFGRYKRANDGLAPSCRACRSEYDRRYNARPEIHAHRLQLRRTLEAVPGYKDAIADKSRCRRFGIEPGAAGVLLDSQAGRCAICLEELVLTGTGRAHLDHDHETGAIRGFLCRKCNTGLGMFLDKPELLANAIDYLSGARHAAVI